MTPAALKEWPAALAREIDRQRLLEGCCLALPLVLLGVYGQDRMALYCLLLTFSAAIIVDALHLTLVGTLLVCSALLTCTQMLFFAQQIPTLFVLCTTGLAAVSVALSSWGKAWRTLGSFVFIPALYLSCEMWSHSSNGTRLEAGISLACHSMAGLPAVLLYALWQGFRHPQKVPWSSLRRPMDVGDRQPIANGVIAICLAVGASAWMVEYAGLAHGQWVIWSSASVITSDFASSRKKGRDRFVAGGWGVLFGVPLALLLPADFTTLLLFSVLGVFSLTCLPRYRLAFGVRSLCAVVVLIVMGEPLTEALWRLGNAALGGVAGVVAMALIAWCIRLHAPEPRNKRR